MPAAAIVSAIAGINNNIIGVVQTVLGAKQGKKANEIASKQADIAQQNVDLTREANEISKGQLDLQKTNTKLGMESTIRGFDKEIDELGFSKMQYGIDIRDAQSQVDSYDKWLGNYSKQYEQEVQSKQAQTDALMASGKEVYDNFLNAIGYSDAAAGATGRVGAGTSQAHTTGMLDQKLVDYVGADRRLDANGGLFGSQLTAANMEMGQLKADLDFQRQEMQGNRDLANASIGDWQGAIGQIDESIVKSTEARNAAQTDLEDFVAKNFLNEDEMRALNMKEDDIRRRV